MKAVTGITFVKQKASRSFPLWIGVCLCSFSLSAVAAPVKAEPRFCTMPLARDYLEPLRNLPHIRELPETGRLPGATRSVQIVPTLGPLAVGGGRAGVALSLRSPAREEVHLNWHIEVQLKRLDAHGRVRYTAGRAQRSVHALKRENYTAISVKMPGRNGLYRMDLQIRSTIGELLGMYSQYLRRVKPRTAVRLRTNMKTFHAGETAYVRLENPGTTAVQFGESVNVERYVNSTWMREAMVPTYYFGVLLEMGGGGAYECRAFPITETAEPGLWRFSQRVDSRPFGKARVVVKQFEVIAEGS